MQGILNVYLYIKHYNFKLKSLYIHVKKLKNIY
jgi:hypothetical protein